jgi:hypothetical protein
MIVMTCRCTAIGRAFVLASLASLAASTGTYARGLAAEPDAQHIYGGGPVDACEWPTTVSLGGCTGTLVHPEVVIYAAHCGSIGEVFLGDSTYQVGRTVYPEFCEVYPGGGPGGGNDWAVCKLSEAVDDIPIVPPLMGCETEVLVSGRTVWIVGFGNTDDGNFGVKYEAETTFDRIENDEAFVGGGGVDTCQGDSGGPVFVQLDDGSWRAFGITSYGDGCGGGGWYSMMHTGMPWFEQTTGIDLTPCHDADGTWNPGPECGEFPLAPGTGLGAWPSCQPGERSGWSSSCGRPFASEDDVEGPSVSIAAPVDGAMFESDPTTGRASIVVDIDADDGQGSGVDEVRLVIDGSPLAQGDLDAPYQFAVNLEPGVYTLSAIAIDAAGNEAESTAVDVGVDERPPASDDGDAGGDEVGSDGAVGSGGPLDGGSDAGPDPALPPGFGLDAADGGCGCTGPGRSWHPLAWLLALGVRGGARRRRSRG